MIRRLALVLALLSSPVAADSSFVVTGIDYAIPAQSCTLWPWPGAAPCTRYAWESNPGIVWVVAESPGEIVSEVEVCGVDMEFRPLCERIPLNLNRIVPAAGDEIFRDVTSAQVTAPTPRRGARYPSHGWIKVGRNLGQADEVRYGIMTVGIPTTQQAVAVVPNLCPPEPDPDEPGEPVCVPPTFRIAWLISQIAEGYTGELNLRTFHPSDEGWSETRLIFTRDAPDIPPGPFPPPFGPYIAGTAIEVEVRVLDPDGTAVEAGVVMQFIPDSE